MKINNNTTKANNTPTNKQQTKAISNENNSLPNTNLKPTVNTPPDSKNNKFNKLPKFKTCTALITPFTQNNKIDYVALKKMIEYQISNNIDAILLLGTTGEGATITSKERKDIITFAVKLINKRCIVLVGTGANSTTTAVKLTKQAKNLGADGAVIVTPFYNKCTQLGLITHYKAINKIGLPFIVYNVPSRTGLNISPTTLLQLEKLNNMIGTKEASGDLNQILQLLNCHTKPVYSGNDKFNNLFIAHGGDGCISVASNLVPNLIVEQFKEKIKSLEIHNKLFNLNNGLFCEVNPIPIKYAMHKFGFCKNIVRKPLTKLTKENAEKILKTLKKL